MCVVVELDEFAPPSIEIWKASLFQLVLVDAPVRENIYFRNCLNRCDIRIPDKNITIVCDIGRRDTSTLLQSKYNLRGKSLGAMIQPGGEGTE